MISGIPNSQKKVLSPKQQIDCNAAFLIKQNFLSEYVTKSEKEQVLKNLGILDKLNATSKWGDIKGNLESQKDLYDTFLPIKNGVEKLQYSNTDFSEITNVKEALDAVLSTDGTGLISAAILSAIQSLQTEVAKLRNSFKYGITSYQGQDTAQGEVTNGMLEVDDKEPLWAIEESDLNYISDLACSLNNNHRLIVDEGTIDVSTDGVLGIEKAHFNTESIYSELTDTKQIFYIAADAPTIKVTLSSTDEETVVDLTNLSKNSVEKYHWLFILSKKYKEKGKQYVYISISNNITGSTLIEGYWNGESLQDSLYDLGTDYNIKSISFENLHLTKMNFYSKEQDFSSEVIPSAPKEQDYKYSAAHITIREVESDTQLESIKNHLLCPELVWVADTQKLKINTKKGIFTIGSSSDDKKDEHTMAEIIEALNEMGITYNDSSNSLALNNIEDIKFISANGDTYKVSVDSEGELVSKKIEDELLSNYVSKAKSINFPSTGNSTSESFTTPSLKAFAAKIFYTIKALKYPLADGVADTEANHIAAWQAVNTANITKDWKLYSDRVKIGQVYMKGTSNNPKCSHAYVELENTSDEDFPLDGCVLYFYNVDKAYNLELSGSIPAGSTYLIRGKKYIDYDEAYIKVKTYDIEWSELDTTSTMSGDVGFALVYKDDSLTLTDGFPTEMINSLTADDSRNIWGLTASQVNASTGAYPYVYDYHHIDCMYITSIASGSKFSPLKGQYAKGSNSICKNVFELDPAKQAFQALATSDSSRIRGVKATDTQIVSLDTQQMVFDKSYVIRDKDVYTPKASYEGKNIITDKTHPDSNKPNMVTCSFGINIATTRCFNWISLNEAAEFVFIKTATGWERFESYGGNNHDISGEFTKKSINTDAEKIIYNRMTGVFPGTTTHYVGHKCILNHATVTTPTTYTYIVGRAGQDGNPDMDYCSDEYTFTLYPTTYIPRIYQITDQQGFHWIEYQVWNAAAIALNDRIVKECASSNIIPILINTGDMTQNGTRINEWLDYYNAGLPLFKHLEQMNVVGNNDLGNANESILGTGDDSGKINPYYFHLFYCYEQPDCDKFIFNNIYIPSTYYFGTDAYKFLMVNSEVTYTACKTMYTLDTLTNIYTGFTMADSTSDNAFTQTYNSNITPIYNTLYNWLNTNKSVTWVAACHEMPFTVVTHSNLNTNTKDKSRSIDASKGSLVGSHLNQLYQYDLKGLNWFSRLLEYFGIKLCIGGHKHTYVCTFPLRENFTFEGKSSKTNQYTMPATLETDNVTWEDSNNSGYNSTKIPASFVSSNTTVEIKDNIISPLVTSNSSLNHVTYLMSQATGYKVKSNKELPSASQVFAKVVAGTSSSSAQMSQLYPMYAIVELESGIKAKLIRLGNILTIDTKTKYTESFNLQSINKSTLTTEYLPALGIHTTIVEDNTKYSSGSAWNTTEDYIYSSTDNYGL